MTTETVNVKELVAIRNTLAISQKELYVAAVTNINMRNRELLKNDLGATFAKNCAWDMADAVIMHYFDTREYNITAQQLVERIFNFSYDNDMDPFIHDSAIRRKVSEGINEKATLSEITNKCEQAQKKLFPKERNNKGKMDYSSSDKTLMSEGKSQYRESKRSQSAELHDELSGLSENSFKHPLEVDHIQAAATAKYNSRYINTQDAVDLLKQFYNSDSNFQMLNKSANGSKGDVKVFSDGKHTISETTLVKEKNILLKAQEKELKAQGFDSNAAKKQAKEDVEKIISNKYKDITYKATAEEYANAICDRWENSESRQNLQDAGILDKDDKVKPDVREKLINSIRLSMNQESKIILQIQDYKKISTDALESTETELKASFKKIIVGQVIYYTLPPLIYETRTLLQKRNMTIDRFFEEIQHRTKRVITYVQSKLSEVISNVGAIAFNKFLKNFFDIVIETVKETCKRLLRLAKSLALSLVNCVKIIVNKNSSAREKADAVTKTLAISVSSVVLEIIFEWAEDQFGLPDIIMEPLQIIVTILATNLIMLVMQKADLFDVQYGFLVANIERVFDEENQTYMEQSAILQKEQKEKMDTHITNLKQQIAEIQGSISTLNLYGDDVVDSLNKINAMFDMGIDFDKEWNDYISAPCGGI